MGHIPPKMWPIFLMQVNKICQIILYLGTESQFQMHLRIFDSRI